MGRPSDVLEKVENRIEAGWKKVEVKLNDLGTEVDRLLKEGSARKIVVERGDNVVAEFPLYAGIFGVVVAPALAAVGALVALTSDCTIKIEVKDDGSDV